MKLKIYWGLVTLLSLLTGCGGWSNWAGNLHCQPSRIIRPTSEAELRSAVRQAARLRVVGAGHSWSGLACTNRVLFDTRALNKVLDLDAAKLRIKVETGVTLHQIDEVVAQQGLALATEPTIDVITAGGAISTASHGTGLAHGAFSEEVVALEVIESSGKKIEIADADRLRAARVGLGSQGVIYSVTFRLVPAFNLELQEQVLAETEAFDHFDELLAKNEHVDLFWFITEHKVYLRTYNRTDAPAKVPHAARDWVEEWVVRTWVAQFGLAVASKIPGIARFFNKEEPRLFPDQHLIDRSDHIFHRFPGHQKVFSMEYLIPLDHTRQAIAAISASLAATGFYPNMPPYLRFVGGQGDGDLSPMRGRPSCAIEVLSYVGFKGWEVFFRDVEKRFRALGGRPHWGKLFYENPHNLYDRSAWAHFNKVRAELDPGRKLDNALLRELLQK